MRRRLAVLPLTAMLAMAGCAALEPPRTSDEACGSITGTWDKFTHFASSPDRDDAEVVERRQNVLSSWESMSTDAPEWTQRALAPAFTAFTEFAGGDTGAYSVASDQVELIREQCVEDGNL